MPGPDEASRGPAGGRGAYNPGGARNAVRPRALAVILCALFVAFAGLPRTEVEVCGGAAGLERSFAAHVKSFNTPRDIPAMLAFEENLVELGHTASDFVDFGSMSREEHLKHLQEGAAKTEIYAWTPTSVQTRVFGPTGVVWGRYQRKHKPVGGETSQAEGLFTATYICSEGRWTTVLWHRSPKR